MSATAFFEVDAANWDAYYERRDVFSVIHQLRRDLALAWAEELALPAGARVAELGCGTGLFAVLLARRGLDVTAVDSAANMLARAEANATAAGVGLQLIQSDSGAVPLPDGGFDLVVALGLIPWVPVPETTLAEMARLTRPGGHVIVNCDNYHRLNVLLDPRYSPALAGARSLRRRQATAEGGGATTGRHTPRQFDALMAAAGLRVERGRTFGFGPFTFLGRAALPERAGLAVHRGFQRLADAGVPGLRGTGSQYIVRAVKSG